jgi:hypothetical protein
MHSTRAAPALDHSPVTAVPQHTGRKMWVHIGNEEGTS